MDIIRVIFIFVLLVIGVILGMVSLAVGFGGGPHGSGPLVSHLWVLAPWASAVALLLSYLLAEELE